MAAAARAVAVLKTTQQLPLPMVAPTAEGFDGLVAGPNAAALAQLRAVAAAGASDAPIYLWGPEGSGKSRLLQALAHAWALPRVGPPSPPPPVLALSPRLPLPWVWEEGRSLVTLDDAQALDAAQQHAAFAVFVEAVGRGAVWVAAGSLPPVDLPLREDLRSRLGWGHVLALKPLDEAALVQALRLEAERRGMPLAEGVVAWLLTRQRRELGHLMRLLSALDGYALARHRAVTLPLLKQMLAEDGAWMPDPAAPETDARPR